MSEFQTLVYNASFHALIDTALLSQQRNPPKKFLTTLWSEKLTRETPNILRIGIFLLAYVTTIY